MNPFHESLINKGYEYIVPQTIYAKPTYRKNGNEVVVCMGCMWVKINGKINKFFTKQAVDDIIKKLP